MQTKRTEEITNESVFGNIGFMKAHGWTQMWTFILAW